MSSDRGEQIAGRPAFQQLLADVQAGKVHPVMVHSFDPWSRNVLVTLQSFRILSQHQVAFIYDQEGVALRKLFNHCTFRGHHPTMGWPHFRGVGELGNSAAMVLFIDHRAEIAQC